MEALLKEHGIKVTANRLSIAKALAQASRPLSLTELEQQLDTIDKSNIFRTLVLFREAHLVHALEDSCDGVRYELCHSHGSAEDPDDDLHVHFHCDSCHKTFCLTDIPVPEVPVPEGYAVSSASYLLHGICPECAGKL